MKSVHTGNDVLAHGERHEAGSMRCRKTNEPPQGPWQRNPRKQGNQQAMPTGPRHANLCRPSDSTSGQLAEAENEENEEDDEERQKTKNQETTKEEENEEGEEEEKVRCCFWVVAV